MLAILLAAATNGFVLVESTARGDYYAPAEDPKLKLDIGTCEEFLENAERRIGVTVPRYAYYRVATAEAVGRLAGIPPAAGAATHEPLRTWSVHPCHRHELAHFVAYRLALPRPLRADSFWHEGFAAWLAGDYGFFDRWNLRQMLIHVYKRQRDVPWAAEYIRRDVTRSSEREGEYRIANAFVHHLIKEYGEDRYLRFFRRLNTVPAEQAFAETFGMSVARASERWLD